jgi:hypothetical protein
VTRLINPITNPNPVSVTNTRDNMKSSISWIMPPCSPMKSQSTFRLKLCLLSASWWFLAWFTSQPWRWRRHIPPKLRLTSDYLELCHKRQSPFITTDVTAWNPTMKCVSVYVELLLGNGRTAAQRGAIPSPILFPTAAAVATCCSHHPSERDAVSHLLWSEFYMKMLCCPDGDFCSVFEAPKITGP